MLAQIQFSCQLGLAALGKPLAKTVPSSEVAEDSSVAFPWGGSLSWVLLEAGLCRDVRRTRAG